MLTKTMMKNNVLTGTDQLFEYYWSKNPLVLTEEGSYKPEDFSNIENPVDMLLVGSMVFNGTQYWAGGLQRLAQGITDEGLRPGIFAPSPGDSKNETHKLLEDPRPSIDPIIQAMKATKNIGFTVFDQDFPLIAFLISTIATDPDLRKKSIYLGGPGIINHFSFWSREILLHLQNLPDDIQIVFVRGEADKVLADTLKGEENLPGVVKINKHSTPPETLDLATVGCGEDGYLDVSVARNWTIEKDVKNVTDFTSTMVKTILGMPLEVSEDDFFWHMYSFRMMIKNMTARILDKGRGCKNRCKYCSQGNITAPVRQISPANAVEQFGEYLSSGKFNLNFSDDDALTDKNWWMEFADRLQESGLDEWIVFGGYTHPSSINKYTDEELKTLIKSGLRHVGIGIQSTNEEELKRMGRNTESLEETLSGIERLKNAGCHIGKIDFIDFYPGAHRNWYTDPFTGRKGIIDDRNDFFKELEKRLGYIPDISLSAFRVDSEQAQRKTIEYTEKKLGLPMLDALGLGNQYIPPNELMADKRLPLLIMSFGRYGSLKQSRQDGSLTFEVGAPWDTDKMIFREPAFVEGAEAIMQRIKERATGKFPEIEKMMLEILKVYALSRIDLETLDKNREEIIAKYVGNTEE